MNQFDGFHPVVQTMKFKRSQLFTELPFIWLYNLKFVECSITLFLFKILILPPALVTPLTTPS
jgi:hypothetical protein